MKELTTVTRCVICDSVIYPIKRALVAPFLARRIWDRDPFCVDLVRCGSCGFRFYNPRLEPEEEARLYRDYRSAEYQQMRHSVEPWYSERFNEELSSDAHYASRRPVLAEILNQQLRGRPIRRVLDYGGDRGDLIKGLLPGAEMFVFDISGKPPAEGVTSVSDASACSADLIVNSNVLEHVGFPRQLLREIVAALPNSGLLFLEVPCEEAVGAYRLMRRAAQAGLTALRRPSLARSVLQTASLYMMHEHINYFTVQSLRALVTAEECEVLASNVYELSSVAGKSPVAWCLAMRRPH